MNLRVAICDDEKNDIKILEQHISQFNIQTNYNVISTSYTKPAKLLSQFKNVVVKHFCNTTT